MFFDDEEAVFDQLYDLENILETHLVSSRQVHGGNLRNFLDEHFHTSTRSRNVSRTFTPTSSYVSGASPTNARMRGVSSSYETNSYISEAIGSVQIGISNLYSNIHKISTVISKDDSALMDGVCAICQEEYKTASDIIRKLNCSHIFCDGCIRKWLAQSVKCPVCKHEMPQE
jgi:hypothetical protein